MTVLSHKDFVLGSWKVNVKCEACNHSYASFLMPRHNATPKHLRNLAYLNGTQSSSSAAPPPAKKSKTSVTDPSKAKTSFPSSLKMTSGPVKAATVIPSSTLPVTKKPSSTVKPASTSLQNLPTVTIDLSGYDDSNGTVDLTVEDPTPSVAVSRPRRSFHAVSYADIVEVPEHDEDRIFIDMEDDDDDDEDEDEDFNGVDDDNDDDDEDEVDDEM